MIVIGILAVIGVVALCCLCGVLLWRMEQKAMEEERK